MPAKSRRPGRQDAGAPKSRRSEGRKSAGERITEANEIPKGEYRRAQRKDRRQSQKKTGAFT
jgi:hypothetical protein